MLLLQGITKSFGPLTALRDVEVTLRPGRVHGVLGENGAGKSTLMRIAAGLLRPDQGTIQLAGRELSLASPLQARRTGIAMVHQHFCLVPTLTVAENCVLGRREFGPWLSRRQIAARISELSERVGLAVDPQASVESLSVGEQQRVEIVRALIDANKPVDAGKVLILDEPTAVLTPQETDSLFAAMDRLRKQGFCIAFISHKLQEVQRICDDLTILRRGACVYQGPASSLTTAQMAEYMVGRQLTPLPQRTPPATNARAALELHGVSAVDGGSHRRLQAVNLHVRGGEILGIAGVEGNGQDVLTALIAGVLRPSGGRVLLDGQDATAWDARARSRGDIAIIPEDRQRQGLAPAMSLRENLVLKSFREPPVSHRGWLRWRQIQEQVRERLTRFDVRPPLPELAAGMLSGGNQQKVVLARELNGTPRLVVAHNPVRGLDVAATQFVFDQLLAQRQRGAGVLLIHSDLDELLSMADRVMVMYGGRCIETRWPDCDRAEIGRLMLGGTPA